jgi:hypothetical protein
MVGSGWYVPPDRGPDSVSACFCLMDNEEHHDAKDPSLSPGAKGQTLSSLRSGTLCMDYNHDAAIQ